MSENESEEINPLDIMSDDELAALSDQELIDETEKILELMKENVGKIEGIDEEMIAQTELRLADLRRSVESEKKAELNVALTRANLNKSADALVEAMDKAAIRQIPISHGTKPKPRGN